jgi:plastocyanin
MRLFYGVLLALLAACGGSTPTGSGGNSNPPPGPAVVSVSMTDNNGLTPYTFAPESLTVAVGTAVKWTNSGKAQHTTTSDAAQPVWNSGTVQPAGTTTCDAGDPYCTPGTTPAGAYQRTFSAAGTYRYHCTVHGTQGMTGVVVVTP